MTPKEALEYLKPFRWEDKRAKEAYVTIKQALTPPTVNEVWKSIKGHDEKYMVSNYGRVKSLNRLVNKRDGQRIVKEKFLSININNKGYCQVSLTTKHKPKLHFIHRLVGEAFIPNPKNKPNINHKDLNPYNNSVGNLEWCTQKENVKHAIDNGRYENVFKVAKNKKPKDFNNHLRKSVVQLDINGNFIKEWDGIGNASKHFKTNGANIVKVCKGKQHTAGGFKWKYSDEFYESLEAEKND